MGTRIDPKTERRAPLTRERVLGAAVALADAHGIDALSMRRLGQELRVEAMSLYNHVESKDDLLDGVVELVMEEINSVVDGIDAAREGWKSALRRRILAARSVLLRHPWAPGVMESRSDISMPSVRYYDAFIGLLREGGFSVDLAHHALHVLGSRALGFTQELYDDSQETVPDETEAFLRQIGDAFPNMAWMLGGVIHQEDDDSTLGWCDDQVEFEFALDLILDGLERLRDAGPGGGARQDGEAGGS